MPIRARVGRHTQQGGRHCQNWVDDQNIVIALLNKVPTAQGGAGGSLRPRVVAGIASNDLYAAIVTFETKNFPGHHSGYIDPGGPMMQKLEALSTPVAVPIPPPIVAAPPPHPPPPPAPTTGSIPRPLTEGEKTLLRDIFKGTLDYDNQVVGRNDSNSGGEWNSFTPGYLPNMSTHIWSWDYSTAPPDHAAIFVHEMVHVWQSGHGRHNLLRGAYLWVKYDDYEDSYKYDLDSSTSLNDYNMEQTAAIIEDYYRLKVGLVPQSNTGRSANLADYAPYVAQLQGAGPFRWPPAGRKDRDYIGHNI
jgi:hypothetical protein